MDDSVLRGMAKWPDVPAVFGWLSLDRRGYWRIKGKKVDHPRSIAFINRNYLADRQGRFYFQNGPQQVFVKLELAPYILFPSEDGAWFTHTGLEVDDPTYAWIDEDGNMGLMSDMGLGLIHDQAIMHASSLLCDASGQELSEAALGETLERFTNGKSDDAVRMRVDQTLVKVRSVPQAELESWGQFVRTPMPETN